MNKRTRLPSARTEERRDDKWCITSDVSQVIDDKVKCSDGGDGTWKHYNLQSLQLIVIPSTCNHFKSSQLPKYPPRFDGSPRTYQTRFRGSPQNFKRVFVWVKGVPLLKRSRRTSDRWQVIDDKWGLDIQFFRFPHPSIVLKDLGGQVIDDLW